MPKVVHYVVLYRALLQNRHKAHTMFPSLKQHNQSAVEVTICSVQPLPGCAPACSLSGQNHLCKRLQRTESNRLQCVTYNNPTVVSHTELWLEMCMLQKQLKKMRARNIIHLTGSDFKHPGGTPE